MTIARPSPTIEVLPRDLSAWEQGNCGVPFVGFEEVAEGELIARSAISASHYSS
jgi:hypothetical protein